MTAVSVLGFLLLLCLGVGSWIPAMLVSMVALTLCGLVLLNERGKLAPELAGIAILMSILDRLTNKQLLQTLIAPKSQPQRRQEIDWEHAREVMREGIIGHDGMIADILGRVQLAGEKVKRSRPVAQRA